MRGFVFILLLLTLWIGVAVSPLVTPLMMCEMQCIKEHGVQPGHMDSDANNAIFKVCRDDCMHANLFEHHFGNQGTLG